MELNVNGFTARTYRWFYAKFEMPDNLCPYFWELVIMWTFILPVLIVSAPMLLINKDDDYIKLPAKIFGGLGIYLIIGLILCMFVSVSILWNGWFPNEENLWDDIKFVGFVCWATVLFFSVLGGIKYISEKIRSRRYKRSFMEAGRENNNVLLEFVKSKYHRYCPKIEWKHKNNE
jgi:hypothetical protein